MIVYHGSDTVVDRPLILKSKRPLDFGGGFYVTSNKDQADSWATKVAYRNASRAKSVNIYDFDYESAKRDLIVLHFDKATALKNLKTEKLCDQILFHTERSLSYIKYIETEVSHYERA